MKIEPLPSDVRSYLRSGVAITSVTQCVEELVLNSLDAKATCVAVRVDLNCFKVQVVDNGSGVPNDQLEILGNRFCTSKCHTLKDLDHLCHFGYRGEALASIRDSCGILEITTRSKLCSKTYCKIFQNGKSLKVAESTIFRPSIGTTITVHELFSNFPVRQKSMNKNFEIERIREMLEGIALIRPGISFTLRNDSTGQVILSTRKCVSINTTFSQLYGSAKADMLVEVKGSKQIFCVQGYIGREGHPRKNLQFVYVNGRLVKKSRIHKLLNKLLLNLPALKPKLRAPSNSPQMLGTTQNLFSSPPKFSEAYPVYILEIKCPISEYDITFEPAKTIVEFKDWETLLTCVEEVTASFLDKENVAVKTGDVEGRINKEVHVKENDKQNVPVISADNMKDVLSSKTVRKITKQKSIDNVIETPDSSNSNGDKQVVIPASCTQERNVFKTPANNTAAPYKAAAGLGSRKLGVETETDNSGSEIENVETKSNFSVLEESYVNGTDEATFASEDVVKDKPGLESREIPVTPHTTVCSLSRFRQSIGKFTGKHSKPVNIDESLKKLNKIMPSSTKSNSRTLFSSLQKFRRRVENKVVAAEPDIEHEEDFKEQEVNSPDKPRDDKEKCENVPHTSNSERTLKGDTEYISRNVVNREEGEQNLVDYLTVNEGTDTDKIYTDRIKMFSLGYEQNEKSSPSQEVKSQFKFSPRYGNFKSLFDNTGRQNFVSTVKDTTENERACDSNDQHVEMHYEAANDVQGEVTGIQKNGVYDMVEYQNIPCEKSSNKPLPCIDGSEGNIELCDASDVRNTRFDRKPPYQESETLYGPEKHFKYTARLLDPAALEMELKYNGGNCDINDNMCNRMNCDHLNLHSENSDYSERDSCTNNCDSNVGFTVINELLHLKSDKMCHEPESTKCRNNETDCVVTNENECRNIVPDITGKLQPNEMGSFIASTQAFSPRFSPEFVEAENPDNCTLGQKTPESLGFTPKLQIEAATPGSTGFKPATEIESSVNTTPKSSDTKSKKVKINSLNDSTQEIKQNMAVSQNLQAESEVDTDKVVDGKELANSDDRVLLNGTNSESVTLTQLLKSPALKTASDRNDCGLESDVTEMDNEFTVARRKGFTFGDLFSQTPTCSMNSDTGRNEGRINFLTPVWLSDISFDSNLGDTEKDKNSCDKCTQKGDNLDKYEREMKNGTVTASVGEPVSEDSEILWTDSPWDISDSSFYLRDEIKLDENDVTRQDVNTVNVSDCQGQCQDEEENPRDVAVKVTADDRNFGEQNMNIMDSLNVWYQNLDAGISGTSNILQSKKPSDVVRKLHSCRFSKESLKSVKVLGQLDKKFIACLINTEQQCVDTDTSMLVLIDQHAAHERIRLEILTEEAFQDGEKSGHLAPFVVDPPQSMTFAEHEVRTILSFQEGYLRLGIKIKTDTPTSVLLSSVPASLVDREKNNKIYWSTIQVLIREHIAVFMSTQVSHGVLPQTIHKVLCSLACHGAIKFGDRLTADECIRLIKDLSRCDLPFQCAHGRPSLTPLFQMDKLQLLTQSKQRAKPRWWKLRQALRKKQQ